MQDTEYLCISKLEKSTVKIILEYTNVQPGTTSVQSGFKAGVAPLKPILLIKKKTNPNQKPERKLGRIQPSPQTRN